MRSLSVLLKICPSLSVSICKAYAYVALYILVAYAVMLWRRSRGATVVVDMLRVCTGHVLMTNYHYLIWPHWCICTAYAPITRYDICDL